nr:unnamed protein product [Callosobruchus chinensis]
MQRSTPPPPPPPPPLPYTLTYTLTSIRCDDATVYGSTFICKEIAILNVAGGTYKHKMLNIPHQFEWLEKKVQYQMG